MLTKDFSFDLPVELIAQHPAPECGSDRLMVLDKHSGEISHHMIADLPDLIPENALMIFNNSKVRKSRVYARVESTGSTVEFLLIKAVPSEGQQETVWRVMAKNAKRQKTGRTYVFADDLTKATIGTDSDMDSGSEFRTLCFNRPLDDKWFEANGHIPLPLYIRRGDTDEDSKRYQTVYAKETGSIAAPTAGLHFTKDMIKRLENKGIETVYITLHVGLGTFLPVRAEHIEEHCMHEEEFYISEEAAEKIEKAHREGRPVIAVGTTSIRTIESAWNEKEQKLQCGHQTTRIFIYPGYTFKVINTIFTNFHTPESTLLMLVSAFGGKEHIMNAYQCAIREKYRFFSYGDAMLIKESYNAFKN